jgi:hypothetical protein
MGFLAELWMPIVLSAVLVFVASSVIHMVIMWHKSDYNQFSNEDEVRAAIRAANAKPGLYVLPYVMDMKSMGTEEVKKKFVDGPVGFVTLKAPGPPTMGGALGQWFAFALAIAVIAAYLASHTLPPGATFLAVCRIVGTVVFLAYGSGSVIQGIWMGRPWRSVAMELLDAAIYAVINGVAFAWLWPHG